MSPYRFQDALEEKRWVDFYVAQERLEIEREKANKINSKFPESLLDFNPKDPAYAKYLNIDLAQDLYADLVNAVSECHAKKDNQ